MRSVDVLLMSLTGVALALAAAFVYRSHQQNQVTLEQAVTEPVEVVMPTRQQRRQARSVPWPATSAMIPSIPEGADAAWLQQNVQYVQATTNDGRLRGRMADLSDAQDALKSGKARCLGGFVYLVRVEQGTTVIDNWPHRVQCLR